MIIDDQEKLEFDTGAKRESKEGKGRCDLLPLQEVSYLYKIKNNIIETHQGKKRERLIGEILEELEKFKDRKDVHEGHFLANAFILFSVLAYPQEGSLETALLELSIHFEEGAKIHGENNWQKGIPVKSYLSSAVRHLLKYSRGDRDENHERAFLWNIICCMYEINRADEGDQNERREK